MTAPLTNVLALHARQLHDESPWIWFYEFEVPGEEDGDPPRRFRVTNSRKRVAFGTNSAGDPVYYEPLPIAHSDLRQTLSGDLPVLTVQVSNPDLTFAAILAQFKGLHDAPCTVRLVNGDALDDYASQVQIDCRVIETAMDDRVVTCKIGGGPLFLLTIPPEIYSRYHCPPTLVEYGGALCGYDLTNPALLAAHPTCSRLEDGDHGCIAHGLAEIAAGLPSKHPERFGGRRSIPRQKRT